MSYPEQELNRVNRLHAPPGTLFLYSGLIFSKNDYQGRDRGKRILDPIIFFGDRAIYTTKKSRDVGESLKEQIELTRQKKASNHWGRMKIDFSEIDLVFLKEFKDTFEVCADEDTIFGVGTVCGLNEIMEYAVVAKHKEYQGIELILYKNMTPFSNEEGLYVHRIGTADIGGVDYSIDEYQRFGLHWYTYCRFFDFDLKKITRELYEQIKSDLIKRGKPMQNGNIPKTTTLWLLSQLKS